MTDDDPATLRMLLDEARLERDGMQRLAIRNRDERDAARAEVAALRAALETVVRCAEVDGDTAGVTTRLAIRQARSVLPARVAAPAAPDCTVTASCEDGDHSRTWPCDYAPGTGRLAVSR